jgi:methylated-DNA-[protein]-cysteine S-methyltransferase
MNMGQTPKSDAPDGPRLTEFRRLVYEATQRIPPSMVATYGWIVQEIGRGSPRAIGGALRANPYAPRVPCHRVVAANGSLLGFGGSSQAEAIARKRTLLTREGVRFDASGRVSRECLLTPAKNPTPAHVSKGTASDAQAK